MPTNLFPVPKNLDWSKFRTFGYPWHGKWEQQQVNGVWKDTLTLITEHDSEETPAPVDETGDSRIPKLPSGTHLIDVQMPWAMSDGETITPGNIMALGGKYWNRALYAPDTGMLYGKNIFRNRDDGDGCPPRGRVDFLYGDPEGVIWGCALYLDAPAQSWVPGLGEPGNLKLSMRRVAGKLLHPHNPESLSPDFVSQWRTIPLSGAASLSALFPNILTEARADSVYFNQVYSALNTGGTNSVPRLPSFGFMDAVPDGSKALYGLQLKGDPSSTLFNYGRPSVLLALLEITLSGTPGDNLSAALSVAKDLPSLFSDARTVEGDHGSEGFIDQNTTWTITKIGSPGEDGYTIITKFRGESEFVSTLRDGRMSETRTGKFNIGAGYVGLVVRLIEVSYDFSAVATTSYFADLGDGVDAESVVVFDKRDVVISKTYTGGSYTVHRVGSGEVHVSATVTVNGDVVASLTGTGSVSFDSFTTYTYDEHNRHSPLYSGSSTLSHTAGASAESGGVEVRYSEHTEGNVGVSTLRPSVRAGFSVGPLSANGYLANITTGYDSIAVIGDFVSPQVVHLRSRKIEGDARVYYAGRVITLGDARHDTDLTPLPAPPAVYIMWCPIRDQLLVTDRTSSWI